MWDLPQIRKMNQPSKAAETNFSRHCSFNGNVRRGIVLHSALKRSTAFVQPGAPAQEFLQAWQAAGSATERDAMVEQYFTESVKTLVSQIIDQYPKKASKVLFETLPPDDPVLDADPQNAAIEALEQVGFEFVNWFNSHDPSNPEARTATMQLRIKHYHNLTCEVDADGSVNGQPVADYIASISPEDLAAGAANANRDDDPFSDAANREMGQEEYEHGERDY